MSVINLRLGAFAAALALLAATSSGALAQKKYDTGASDTEIKIGNIMPYSGPASAYGVIGKTEEAISGRSTPRAASTAARSTSSAMTTPTAPRRPWNRPASWSRATKCCSSSIARHAAEHGDPEIPQHQEGAATVRRDRRHQMERSEGFPWTMGWQPNYQSESQIYAKYILKNNPNGKIAVLYQNDDYGKDYLKGFKDGLGAKAASMIVIEESYEVSEPTIDSHIVKMKSTGADIFFNITTPKFAAQAIKKNAEIGWKPLHFLNNVSGSIGSVMKPAGFENAQDIISSAYLMDPTDKQWDKDAGMIAWNQFLDKYYPEGNRADASLMYAYTVAQGLAHVLKACGDDLTRANIMDAGGQHQGPRTRRPTARPLR
jgi:branched-chain amino acid transport system substrate-binding protein